MTKRTRIFIGILLAYALGVDLLMYRLLGDIDPRPRVGRGVAGRDRAPAGRHHVGLSRRPAVCAAAHRRLCRVGPRHGGTAEHHTRVRAAARSRLRRLAAPRRDRRRGEDQRFHEHTGFDLREIDAAWSLDQRQREAARGGSTLSRQLAKLIYTSDDRHHLRKLRELLYAVELDRTLGKARGLHVYLAMAPWGASLCGAAAASRHYLNQRVDRLTPTEAAWLASLLRRPDASEVDTEHVAWVIAHLRPMPTTQRQALVEALPQWHPKR